MSACSRRRQLWRVSGESSIWTNYPTKPVADKNSRLFLLETEDLNKLQFVRSAFNRSGSKLATVDQRGNVHEYDFKTFKCDTVSRCGLFGHAVSYSKRHDDIAVALHDKSIRIFECGTYRQSATIKTQHKEDVHSIEYCLRSDGSLVLLSCSPDICVLWDIDNHCQQIQCLSHNYSITFVEFIY